MINKYIILHGLIDNSNASLLSWLHLGGESAHFAALDFWKVKLLPENALGIFRMLKFKKISWRKCLGLPHPSHYF